MADLFAGIDAGKSHHHCVVIDTDGNRLLSQKIANAETVITTLIDEVNSLTDPSGSVTWATDLNRGWCRAAHRADERSRADAALHSRAHRLQRSPHLPRRREDRCQRRRDHRRPGPMRRDLQPIRLGDDIATELRLLTAHRTDLTCDRTRAINRMRASLGEFFPGLEAAFDYSTSKAALLLLTGYQTPAGIRRMGAKRLSAWLKKRGARSAARVAEIAVDAAGKQHTTVPGQDAGAMIVARLAAEILRLADDITGIENRIEDRFREHADAKILLSMPGFGPLLGAEFTAATGGGIDQFDSANRLAGVAGLAPAPRDSGRISGNHHRPKRYDRRLLRACYLAAQVASRWCPVSKAFYDRKRAEGKNHKQAILALARRRINVLWAMLRDRTMFGQGISPIPG
jgi:transposase